MKMEREKWEEEGSGMEGAWEKEVDMLANEGKEAREERGETREDSKQEEEEGGKKMEMKKGVMREEGEGEGEEEMEMKTGVMERERAGEEEGRVGSYYRTGRRRCLFFCPPRTRPEIDEE